jgi:TRAP-type mannitol/chloroaromatic compound transport system substrate-binding protein
VGLAVDIFTEMGTAVNPPQAAKSMPALAAAHVDAAEFNST